MVYYFTSEGDFYFLMDRKFFVNYKFYKYKS